MDIMQNRFPAKARLSEEEQGQLLIKAWELWRTQAQKYCGMDSTSLTVERAQELLESALYTITLASRGSAPQGDYTELLHRGQEILHRKTEELKTDWLQLMDSLPRVQNIYFHHTVTELGAFFRRYDFYYGAHLVPCDINYWPMCPVQDTLQGVSYMEAYLQRIRWETDFVRCFMPERVRSLYRSFIPHHSEMLFNLCEPVLWNTIGLTLLQRDIYQLTVTAEERGELLHLLQGKTVGELHQMVESAAAYVCRFVGMQGGDRQNYFLRAADELPVRLRAAAANGDVSHVFLQFEV